MEWDWRSRGQVPAIAFTPKGNGLLLASDSVVKLWRPGHQEELAVLVPGHRGAISSVAVCPTTGLAATAALDDLVKLWDVTRM